MVVDTDDFISEPCTKSDLDVLSNLGLISYSSVFDVVSKMSAPFVCGKFCFAYTDTGVRSLHIWYEGYYYKFDLFSNRGCIGELLMMYRTSKSEGDLFEYIGLEKSGLRLVLHSDVFVEFYKGYCKVVQIHNFPIQTVAGVKMEQSTFLRKVLIV